MHIQDGQGRTIITGRRGPTSKLWVMDLANPVDTAIMPRQALAIQGVPVRSLRELTQYYHQAMGCPAASTLLRAVKNFLTLPGLDYEQLLKHQDVMITTATDKGHLDQARQGQRSTKPAPDCPVSFAATEEDDDPAEECDVVLRIPTEEERVSMDLTGKLHNFYLMVVYVKSKNYIKLVTTQSRRATDLVQAFSSVLTFLERHSVTTSTVRMDNEVSATFHDLLAEKHIEPEFVPPGMHRRNEAERAIRTAKNHIIATLANTDPAFPMGAVAHTVAQAEITLNLLRPAAGAPTTSAWEAMFGRPYDFNRHPLAPVGTRVIVHEKPHLRETWAAHGVEGFYVGPKLDGYRMYTVYIPRTRHTRDTDTLSWHFNTLETKTNCPHERLAAALTLLQRAIRAIHPADITPRSAPQYRDAAREATALAATLTARIHEFRRNPPTTSDATLQTLPPSVDPPQPDDASQLDPEPSSPSTFPAAEQRVPAAKQRVPAAEQRVPAAPSQPQPAQSEQRVMVDTTPTEPIVGRNKREHTLKNARRRNKRKGQRDSLHALLAYECTAAEYDYACALMVERRFSGNSRGGRGRRAAPGPRSPRRQPRRKRKTRLEAEDELYRQGMAHANTAVDLDENGHKLVYHRAKNGPDGAIWEKAGGTEIIKLITSDTGRWIRFKDIPPGRRAAYYNPRCRIKMKQGKLQHRVRGTIGGDKVDFDGDTAAYTASMPTLKILLNAVVSKKGAKFATADIKDYYLGTPLTDKHGRPAVEYMRIQLDLIPADVQAMYNLADFEHNGAVYMEISKSIYGLPQSGRQSQDRLIKHLKAHDYLQCRNTPSLFRHKTRDIAFTLVVDDFGIMYTDDADLDHFLATLRMQYEITEDRDVKQKYVGITIEHDRSLNTITLSMPGYIEKALARFQMTDARKASSPALYTPPEYGAKIHFDEVEDDTPITAEEKTRIQQIVGVLLFYARAVDPTMLCAVNKLASHQADPSATTVTQANRILQYAAKYPAASILLKASDMQLRCHSDASYLSEANSRSRAGGILFLGDADTTSGVHGAIDYLSCIISTVVSSAAEAEYAALYLVGREALCASQTLTDLGFPQAATLIICDNQCAVGIANRNVKQKRSKAINMRYHWIRDQVDLEAVTIEWQPGAANLADFFTKNHPTKHHSEMRNIFVHDKPQEKLPQICVLAHVAGKLPYNDTNNRFNCIAAA